MDFFIVLVAAGGVMLMSLSGKLITWRGLGPIIERNMHLLVSFAAGVLLVIAYNLIAEIVEHEGSLASGLPWVALGAVVVLVAFRYIPNFHHHHEKGDHAHTTIDANRILASDAMHNVGDGVVIVTSFAVSPIVGLASTLSIMVHEMLQEISEFFVLREAGLSIRRALVLNFLTSATVLVGAIGGYFLLEQFENLTIPLLGLSAGAYLVVVFNDLIPHSIEHSDKGHYWKHILFFIVGICLMSTVVTALPHEEHGHTEEVLMSEIA